MHFSATFIGCCGGVPGRGEIYNFAVKGQCVVYTTGTKSRGGEAHEKVYSLPPRGSATLLERSRLDRS